MSTNVGAMGYVRLCRFTSMATRHVAQLIDDLDGTPLEEGEGKQITFSIEGRVYEIDLSDKNADTFFQALAPFVNAARPTGSAATPRAGSRATRAKSDVNLAAVRKWARENGHTVSDRGRVPATIVEAYKAAAAEPVLIPPLTLVSPREYDASALLPEASLVERPCLLGEARSCRGGSITSP
ncbi:histone-like nucleoid-structuring protein Lsr2 [Microbacterium trichothecenolyticum]|uniref:Lsr2 protein n=1 Tax=Microbacterium trichothecenolyticum TaxID=69370 RepID=A0ABU0TZ62_MICTR|nr:Lsr2 family protein [Microbacterium trichothecenolyticum]MDQ1124951.1 hypothetical protein [Microbacterium trichothecenolyticum]